MTQIDLAYPKIQGSKKIEQYNEPCLAFEKYDGSNLHWVWEKELGWYAFGTRRDRFDLDEKGKRDFHSAHPGLEEAPDIFQQKLALPLSDLFRRHPGYREASEITVFTEFLGPGSFAGMHKREDPKSLVLFDVQPGETMIPPDRFLQDFGEIGTARVVYRGKLTGKFIQDLREGKFGVAEGVVCKGVSREGVWMVKIKTNAYMKKLKEAFKEDWENYWE